MRKTLMMIVVAAAASCAGVADNTGEDSAAATGAADTTATASYADVEEWANEQGDEAWQTWEGITATLKHDFDDICGDTYCGGDYANLEPLRLRCSLNTTTQVLKNCTYVFAGSYEVVNPTTGTIRVTAKTFSCHISVTGMALADFEKTLTDAGSTPPLQRPLPGKTTSIYDALGGCL